jgi:hypothetical protein
MKDKRSVGAWYDYANQAWVIDGVYAACGHAPCACARRGDTTICYGTLHEGESAWTTESEVRDKQGLGGTRKMKLNWTQTQDEEDTHYCADGVAGYYVAAPSLTARQIAEAFAATYDRDAGAEPGYTVVKICAVEPDGGTPLIAYFAFDGEGDFEWHTDRMGGARGGGLDI